MGAPQYPTEEQIARMNAATALKAPTATHLEQAHLTLTLKPNALALIEIAPAR
jgi:beta-xylosidase